jgi:hypothetical protein
MIVEKNQHFEKKEKQGRKEEKKERILYRDCCEHRKRREGEWVGFGNGVYQALGSTNSVCV